MQILVTGASGFVGRALCRSASSRFVAVKGLSRTKNALEDDVQQVMYAGTGMQPGDWADAVEGCDAVIHLAARAHILKESSEDPLALFREANVDLAVACAEAAALAGVRRFVFVSSIGVNGNVTGERAFKWNDEPAPHSPYAVSKYEAELALQALCKRTGMELVIVRPPLVYGEGVPGNFLTMMRWLYRGVPLPLGSVTGNRRSLVALDNLVDLLMTCAEHPAAANQIFLVCDEEDLSTTDLLLRLGKALGRPARLLSVPVSWLAFGIKLTGKIAISQRLLSSLQIDMSHTVETLQWTPPCKVDEGLSKAAERFLQERAED